MKKNERNTSVDSHVIKKNDYQYHYYYDEDELNVFQDENSFYHSWSNKYPPASRFSSEKHEQKSYYGDNNDEYYDEQGLDWYYDNIKTIERDNTLNKLLDIPYREINYKVVDHRSIEPLTISIKDLIKPNPKP